MGGEDQHDGGPVRGLAIHAVVFVAVNLLLIAAWVLFGTGTTDQVPTYLGSLSASRDAGFWPMYVLVLWGAGLLIHAGIVLVGVPARRRARRRRRQERRRLHASVVGALDGTPLEGVALAGVRMVDGDKAAQRAKKDATKKRKKARRAARSTATPGSSKTSTTSKTPKTPKPSKGTKPSKTPGPTPEPAPEPVQERTDSGAGSTGASGGGPSRDWVAVLFTDIVDSTALNRRLGDDAWATVLVAHRALVRGCIGDHRGVEVGTQGDGFLVRFAVPDDAAACAVELQRRLADDRTRASAAGSAGELHVRMGIHAGQVVMDDDDVVGSVINLASRVTAVAGADEILVTEPLADHLTPGHLLVDRGLRSLKGFDQPRHLLALVWDEATETIDLADDRPSGLADPAGR